MWGFQRGNDRRNKGRTAGGAVVRLRKTTYYYADEGTVSPSAGASKFLITLKGPAREGSTSGNTCCEVTRHKKRRSTYDFNSCGSSSFSSCSSFGSIDNNVSPQDHRRRPLGESPFRREIQRSRPFTGAAKVFGRLHSFRFPGWTLHLGDSVIISMSHTKSGGADSSGNDFGRNK